MHRAEVAASGLLPEFPLALLWRPGGRFFGNSAFDDARLADVAGFKKNRTTTSHGVSAAVRRIERFYRQHGYSDVRITSRHGASQRFEVEDVYFIVVEGNHDSQKSR